jgi:hypothetical protein
LIQVYTYIHTTFFLTTDTLVNIIKKQTIYFHKIRLTLTFVIRYICPTSTNQFQQTTYTTNIHAIMYTYIQARNAYIQNTWKEINIQARLPDHLHNPTQRHHYKRLICSTCNKRLSIIIKVIESDYSRVNKRKNKSNTNNMFASF